MKEEELYKKIEILIPPRVTPFLLPHSRPDKLSVVMRNFFVAYTYNFVSKRTNTIDIYIYTYSSPRIIGLKIFLDGQIVFVRDGFVAAKITSVFIREYK